MREGKEPPLACKGDLFAVRPIAVFIDDNDTPFYQQPEARKYIFLDRYCGVETEKETSGAK